MKEDSVKRNIKQAIKGVLRIFVSPQLREAVVYAAMNEHPKYLAVDGLIEAQKPPIPPISCSSWHQ